MDTKRLARAWIQNVWNKQNPNAIAELMDPLVKGVSEGGEVRGPEEFRKVVFEPFVRAFPDVKVAIRDLIAEKNEVAIRWTVSGTHLGPLLHLPPTGKRVEFSGMTWLQFKRGKIIGGSDSYNLHALIGLLSGGDGSASVRLV